MPLLGEGIGVWVQVEAEVVGESTFRVKGPEPTGQAWSFAPDTIVRCEAKILVDCRTRGLFAVESLTEDNDDEDDA